LARDTRNYPMDTERRDLVKNIRLRALNLLALREHTRQELQIKLEAKFHDKAIISQLLDELEATHIQSDERYAEMFLRSRVRKGHGPNRIKVDLDKKGVTSELSHALLGSDSVDWRRLALTVLQRKCGEKLDLSKTDIARNGRFLAQRGFSTEQIYQAFKDYNNSRQ
jgi:regulatory protein